MSFTMHRFEVTGNGDSDDASLRRLLDAARDGDAATLEQLLAEGVPANVFLSRSAGSIVHELRALGSVTVTFSADGQRTLVHNRQAELARVYDARLRRELAKFPAQAAQMSDAGDRIVTFESNEMAVRSVEGTVIARLGRGRPMLAIGPGWVAAGGDNIELWRLRR
jgi:hypothetical protein